jgi:hypothetical protein
METNTTSRANLKYQMGQANRTVCFQMSNTDKSSSYQSIFDKKNIHVKEVKATRTEHRCRLKKNCLYISLYQGNKIEIGKSARVVTEVIDNPILNKTFYKTYYYHIVCFLQTYPSWSQDHENS